MKNLEIEYIDINQLTPYENNVKLHTKAQIRQIANSIEQFGLMTRLA